MLTNAPVRCTVLLHSRSLTCHGSCTLRNFGPSSEAGLSGALCACACGIACCLLLVAIACGRLQPWPLYKHLPGIAMPVSSLVTHSLINHTWGSLACPFFGDSVLVTHVHRDNSIVFSCHALCHADTWIHHSLSPVSSECPSGCLCVHLAPYSILTAIDNLKACPLALEHILAPECLYSQLVKSHEPHGSDCIVSHVVRTCICASLFGSTDLQRCFTEALACPQVASNLGCTLDEHFEESLGPRPLRWSAHATLPWTPGWRGGDHRDRFALGRGPHARGAPARASTNCAASDPTRSNAPSASTSTIMSFANASWGCCRHGAGHLASYLRHHCAELRRNAAQHFCSGSCALRWHHSSNSGRQYVSWYLSGLCCLQTGQMLAWPWRRSMVDGQPEALETLPRCRKGQGGEAETPRRMALWQMRGQQLAGAAKLPQLPISEARVHAHDPRQRALLAGVAALGSHRLSHCCPQCCTGAQTQQSRLFRTGPWQSSSTEPTEAASKAQAHSCLSIGRAGPYLHCNCATCASPCHAARGKSCTSTPGSNPSSGTPTDRSYFDGSDNNGCGGSNGRGYACASVLVEPHPQACSGCPCICQAPSQPTAKATHSYAHPRAPRAQRHTRMMPSLIETALALRADPCVQRSLCSVAPDA